MKLGLVGHSLGAKAVSQVQGYDKRVAAIVALDKLTGGDESGLFDVGDIDPKVPALGMQSEYGFTAQPYVLSSGTTAIAPTDVTPPFTAPDPQRERATGFDPWTKDGVDSMVIVPRASTHLDYADVPLVLPASRYGQALSSSYTQVWFGRYLKHEGVGPDPTGADPLLSTSFKYLEPTGLGLWQPITLQRDSLLSFYFCSAYSITDRSGTTKLTNGDIVGVGGCKP